MKVVENKLLSELEVNVSNKLIKINVAKSRLIDVIIKQLYAFEFTTAAALSDEDRSIATYMSVKAKL